MEKTISVTLTLDKNGAAINFYEGESGDSFCLLLDGMDEDSIVNRIGWEIYGWLSIMADELEEQEDE